MVKRDFVAVMTVSNYSGGCFIFTLLCIQRNKTDNSLWLYCLLGIHVNSKQQKNVLKNASEYD